MGFVAAYPAWFVLDLSVRSWEMKARLLTNTVKERNDDRG